MDNKMKGLRGWLSVLLLVCLLFAEFSSMKVTAAAEAGIPTIDGYATGEAHDAGGGYSQLTYSGVSLSEMKTYEQKLMGEGYTIYDQREIQNGGQTNRFATYVKGDTMIHLNLFATLGLNQFHVIYGPADKLVPNGKAGSYTAVVTPSVAIIERTDGVLCMVVQLADGSYYVIDGGYGYAADKDTTLPTSGYRDDSGVTETFRRDYVKDMETLLAYLQDTNRDGKIDSADTRPQVTWMITHADVDHIHLPYTFIKTYNSKFDLQAVYYNFPNYEEIGISATYADRIGELRKNANNFVERTNTYFPNAKQYVYHTGQTVDLPGCTLEFLYTPEDMYPNSMHSPNHTCGIWRFCFDNGKTFLVTGDAEVETNKQAAAVFGSYLKSDMLQVIHHGYEGGTLEFYGAVDPDICFWPCLNISFAHDLRQLGTYNGYSFNALLRNGERTHYTTSATHTVFLPTLHYDANGGTGTAETVGTLYENNTANEGVAPDGVITVANNPFAAPEGKIFLGWATTPTGNVEYLPGEQIEIKTDTVLYAVWRTENYIISIGDVEYDSLEDALAAAKQTPEADTITLLGNVEVTSHMVINTEVILIAEEAVTITAADTQTGSMFRVVEGGKLTIQGSTEAPITLTAGVNTTNLVVTNGGETILTNVKMVGNENPGYGNTNKACGIFNDGGTVTAKGVQIESMKGDGIYILDDGIVNLDDVTISGSGRYGIKVKGMLNLFNTVCNDHALSISGSADHAMDVENGGMVVCNFANVPADTCVINLFDNMKEGLNVRAGGDAALSYVSQENF